MHPYSTHAQSCLKCYVVEQQHLCCYVWLVAGLELLAFMPRLGLQNTEQPGAHVRDE